MLPSGISMSTAAAAAWLSLLTTTVSAIPNPNNVHHAVAPRQTQSAVNPTDAWVTVDESGKPKTITPVLTTISGTPTIISGAPYEVTGTVFTSTRADVKLTTITGAAQPKATGADGSGAFAVCHNLDGPFAPFCDPQNNATLYPDGTYYVKWDPEFFNSTNTTVRLAGFYNSNDTDEAFSSDPMAAGWGFYRWPITAELYSSQHKSAVNITLRIAALPAGSAAKWYPGPVVHVMPSPTPLQEPAKLPSGPALYIALPTVLGFVALCVVGGCIWNAKKRRIGLGNVMGRGRHGYGVGQSRRQRIFGKGRGKEQIRLTERDGPQYRDEPHGDGDEWRREVPGRVNPDDRPRRDSDALGSLAGTPTQDRFDFARPGFQNAKNGGHLNVFRQEMDRQKKERD
ncbi:hypothetical protein OQA88_4197 [Cercophora sp. LCS_1]